MEDERLKDTRLSEELMDVKVDVHSEDLHTTNSDVKSTIQDRDPKRINNNLKVFLVHRHEDDLKHTQTKLGLKTQSTGHKLGLNLSCLSGVTEMSIK